MTDSQLDRNQLRRTLGTFATGVTVVTTVDEDGNPRGFTANSFTSVSLDPPLVLVCIDRKAEGYPAFAQASGFTVNILAEDQREVSARFATSDIDRFAGTDWTAGETASPILTDTVGWLECRMHATTDGGDHLILIGEVVAHDHRPGSPLGYCRGSYVSFGLSEEALEATGRGSGSWIAAIIEHDGTVLLDGDPHDGPLTLPWGPRVGDRSEAESLNAKLHRWGVDASLDFLFSVYEDQPTGEQHIVYRGEARRVGPESTARLFPFESIPWDRVEPRTVRAMLRRYIAEREGDGFAIYVGDDRRGRVEALARESEEEG